MSSIIERVAASLIETYELVETREHLINCVNTVEQYHADDETAFVALDCETRHVIKTRHGLDITKDEVPRPIMTKKGLRGKATLLQIGLDPDIKDQQFILNIPALNRNGVSDKEIGDLLRPVLESARILGHNLKYEYQFMWRQFGIKLRHLRCLMLFAQILYAGDDMVKFGLASLCSTVFGQELYGWFIERMKAVYGIEMDYEGFVTFKKEQQTSDWSGDTPMTKNQLRYAADDVALPFDLWKGLQRRLDEFISEWGTKMPGDITDEIKLEWDAIPAFAMMELRGFQLNVENYKKLVDKLFQQIQDAEEEVGKTLSRKVKMTNKLRGTKRKEWEEIVPINLRSHVQVKKALEEALGHPIANTKAETLEKYVDEHVAVQQILNFKKAEHAHSHFGLKYLHFLEDTGRVHTNIFQTGTETGRSAFGEPNFQNVPASEEFRENFIAAEGKKLQISDLSQIEPRLTAAFTGDLVEEFCEVGDKELDLHALTGKDMLGLDYLPKKGSVERDKVGKRSNLGLSYRMGHKKLALDILSHTKGEMDWTVNDFEEAKNRVKNYWMSRKRTKRKMDEMDRDIKKRALAAGTLAVFKGRKPIAVVFSKVGRPRRFCLEAKWESLPDEDLQKSPGYEYGKFEYRLNKICLAGWNHGSAQSCAASLLKRSVIGIHNELEEKGFDYDTEGLIAVVHDEGIIECAEERGEEAAEILERHLVKAGTPLTYPVPCIAKTKVNCPHWWAGK